MIDIPCVILAGGRSSRMQEDKCFLPFANHKSLVQYQYDKLSKIFKKVYISSKIKKFPINSNFNLILDEYNTYSPLIALQSIFNNINDEKVFIITVDAPLVSEENMLELINKSKNFEITIAKDKSIQHNLIGVFNRGLLNNINENIKNNIHKINYLIKNSKNNIVEFENESEFINLNTKDDYKKALLLL